MRFITLTLISAGLLSSLALAEVIPVVPEKPLALWPDPPNLTANPAHPGDRLLDEWLNIRINSDETGQVQNEQQVVANPIDPDNIVAVWRDFRLGYRRVGVGYSFDGGFTWTDDLFYDPNFPLQSDPGLTYHSSGAIYAVTLSYDNMSDALMVASSTDGGLSWSSWVASVVNYDPDLFEDKELMACDRSGSQYDGNLYVTWARFDDTATTVTTIMLVRSTNGGILWSDPVPVSDEHGVQWPVPVVGPEGEVYIGWVKYYTDEIRFDRSFDGGVTWGDDIIVKECSFASAEINPQLLIFAYPAMDVDITNGPYRGNIYMAYTDEIYGDTDIFFTGSRNQGESWSPSIRVNDDDIGNGADQFHPWLVCDENGTLHLIFYDRRNDLQQNLFMDLYYTYSTDAGQNWAPNERITTVSSNPALDSTYAESGLIGEYNGLAVMNGIIHPVWTDTRNGHQDTYTAVWDTSSAIGLSDPRPNRPATPALDVKLAPNPFNSALTIELLLQATADVRLTMFDLQGRMVEDWPEQHYPAGPSQITWRPLVTSGLYLLRVTSGSEARFEKVLYLK